MGAFCKQLSTIWAFYRLVKGNYLTKIHTVKYKKGQDFIVKQPDEYKKGFFLKKNKKKSQKLSTKWGKFKI